jgi:putative transcriptional regulator
MGDAIAPGFLIAVPQLQDPNFKQSVVLLLQQSDEGALGVVVNRETSLLLKDLCRDHEIDYAGDPAKRVRLGGPVQPEQGLVVLGGEHQDPEARPVADDLLVSASTGTLSRLCNLSQGRFHCYSGYAGWAPGQLEREIAEGSWIVTPVDAKLILDLRPEEMWVEALKANGIDPAAIVPGSPQEA